MPAYNRRGDSRLQRSVNTRPLRQRFLIVCEGEETEPNYFRGFRLGKDVMVAGTGYNTVSLVERARELSESGDYDQVWCVFDRDSFPVHDFNEAIRLAKRYDFHLAYSNEAFELWYVLHFNFHQAATARSLYPGMLTHLLGHKYEKNSRNMYSLLEGRQETAIVNAKRLINVYTPHNPATDNPCTTVFELVEELRKFTV
ncbi:MAG TPA: RloB family protein [Longimicrobium sp.]|jgi:hypothetical protein